MFVHELLLITNNVVPHVIEYDQTLPVNDYGQRVWSRKRQFSGDGFMLNTQLVFR